MNDPSLNETTKISNLSIYLRVALILVKTLGNIACKNFQNEGWEKLVMY